jgi:putative ABC transport system permease protein
MEKSLRPGPVPVEEEADLRPGDRSLGKIRVQREGPRRRRLRSLPRLARLLEAAYPDTNRDWGARVESFRDNVLAGAVLAMVLMYSAISLVLLIACSNVANLMLARAATREKEMCLRTALGASRLRLLRQLLTESVSLALLGGALGLVIGYWGMSALKTLYNASPAFDVVTQAMHLDLAVLGHTTLVSVLAGVLFGVVPAFQGSKADLRSALKDGGWQAGGALGRLRLKNLLVVGQVALALALLTTTTLLIRAESELWSVDPGFDPENLLTIPIELPEASYPSHEGVTQFYRDALNRMADGPGIDAAAAATRLPLSRFAAIATTRVLIEDRPELDEGEAPTAIDVVVSPRYFKALQIPVLRGRGLSATDKETSMPVAVVSEAFVRRYWLDAEPLGKRFQVGAATHGDPWIPVVGVSRDVLTNAPSLESLDDVTLPHAFLPMAHHPRRSMTLLLRSQTNVAAVTGWLRDTVRQIDPNQAIATVSTMEERLEQQRISKKTGMYIFSTLSGVALVLAGVGIYGVIS